MPHKKNYSNRISDTKNSNFLISNNVAYFLCCDILIFLSYFLILKKRIFDINNPILKNLYPISKKYSEFFFIEKFIFWYQKFKVLISIYNLFFWYQEYTFLISEIDFLIPENASKILKRSFILPDIKQYNF